MSLPLRCSSASSSIFKSHLTFKLSHSFPNSFSFQTRPNSYPTSRIFCRAANSKKTDPLKNNKNNSSSSSSSSSNSKKKKKNKNSEILNTINDFEILNNESVDANVQKVVSDSYTYYSDDFTLPEPPTGFNVDDEGNVSLTSTNRVVTIVDPMNDLPLVCVIRRMFKSSDRDECMLVCPIDTPVHILKNTRDGWSAINDEEVESILPAAAFALAKIHMHLINSGYCYTARGGFCYTEQDILDFHTDDGEKIDGVPSEGVEVTCFDLEDTRYLIYTPPEPLLFVVVKDENGVFQMADDDLLDDPAVIDGIDEETEFNALVEEEAALIEAMMTEDEEDEE